jgi:FkbM family methyltransferase
MIKRFIKNTAKQLLTFLGINITKNQQYDRQTKTLMQRILKTDSNCIDIGCFKGEILDLMRKYAPQGKHVGFEPIPEFAEALKKKYQHTSCEIRQIALSDTHGTSDYQYVMNAPSYSGIVQRKYNIKNPNIKRLQVKKDTLDNQIQHNTPVDLIKIDVEGGELSVLSGGKSIIKANRPYIIFEFGLGASEYYDATPEKMYDLLVDDLGLHITLMKNWIKGSGPLNKKAFCNQYYEQKNHYFLAYP